MLGVTKEQKGYSHSSARQKSSIAKRGDDMLHVNPESRLYAMMTNMPA